MRPPQGSWLQRGRGAAAPQTVSLLVVVYPAVLLLLRGSHSVAATEAQLPWEEGRHTRPVETLRSKSFEEARRSRGLLSDVVELEKMSKGIRGTPDFDCLNRLIAEYRAVHREMMLGRTKDAQLKRLICQVSAFARLHAKHPQLHRCAKRLLFAARRLAASVSRVLPSVSCSESAPLPFLSRSRFQPQIGETALYDILDAMPLNPPKLALTSALHCNALEQYNGQLLNVIRHLKTNHHLLLEDEEDVCHCLFESLVEPNLNRCGLTETYGTARWAIGSAERLGLLTQLYLLSEALDNIEQTEVVNLPKKVVYHITNFVKRLPPPADGVRLSRPQFQDLLDELHRDLDEDLDNFIRRERYIMSVWLLNGTDTVNDSDCLTGVNNMQVFFTNKRDQYKAVDAVLLRLSAACARVYQTPDGEEELLDTRKACHLYHATARLMQAFASISEMYVLQNFVGALDTQCMTQYIPEELHTRFDRQPLQEYDGDPCFDYRLRSMFKEAGVTKEELFYPHLLPEDEDAPAEVSPMSSDDIADNLEKAFRDEFDYMFNTIGEVQFPDQLACAHLSKWWLEVLDRARLQVWSGGASHAAQRIVHPIADLSECCTAARIVCESARSQQLFNLMQSIVSDEALARLPSERGRDAALLFNEELDHARADVVLSEVSIPSARSFVDQHGVKRSAVGVDHRARRLWESLPAFQAYVTDVDNFVRKCQAVQSLLSEEALMAGSAESWDALVVNSKTMLAYAFKKNPRLARQWETQIARGIYTILDESVPPALSAALLARLERLVELYRCYAMRPTGKLVSWPLRYKNFDLFAKEALNEINSMLSAAREEEDGEWPSVPAEAVAQLMWRSRVQEQALNTFDVDAYVTHIFPTLTNSPEFVRNVGSVCESFAQTQRTTRTERILAKYKTATIPEKCCDLTTLYRMAAVCLCDMRLAQLYEAAAITESDEERCQYLHSVAFEHARDLMVMIQINSNCVGGECSDDGNCALDVMTCLLDMVVRSNQETERLALLPVSVELCKDAISVARTILPKAAVRFDPAGELKTLGAWVEQHLRFANAGVQRVRALCDTA